MEEFHTSLMQTNVCCGTLGKDVQTVREETDSHHVKKGSFEVENMSYMSLQKQHLTFF